MTYVSEITLALVRVLEAAVYHNDRLRLAGYAANIDFWAAEIRHSLDCLEGYESRFERLKSAREAAAEASAAPLDPAYVTPTVSRDEIGRLRDRLLGASARFLRLCAPVDRAEELEMLVGVRIRDRRPNID